MNILRKSSIILLIVLIGTVRNVYGEGIGRVGGNRLETIKTVRNVSGVGISELGVSVSGGVSLMLSKNINPGFKDKLGGNTSVGLHYGYNINKNWALLLGLEMGYVETNIEAKNTVETVSETSEYYHPLSPHYITLDYISRIDGLHEKDQMINAQASVMVRYQTPTLRSRYGYYVASGVKIGGGLWSRYKYQINSLTFEGDFNAFRQHFENIPEKNFITIENVRSEGKASLSAPTVSSSFETGIRFRLTAGKYLYVGVFADYEMSSLFGALRVEKADSPVVTFKPVGSQNYDYKGLLNTARRSGIYSLQAGIKITVILDNSTNERMKPANLLGGQRTW